MATTLSKTYSHCWGEFFKGIDDQGPYYECAFKFDDWADADSIANEIMGLSTRVGSKTVRGVPLQHPLSPNLYAKSVRIEGLGGPATNAPGYPKYDAGFKALVTFRSNIWNGPYQTSDDPQNLQAIDPATPILWCTQELDFETEVFTVPTHSYQWLSDGKKAGIPVKVELALTVMKLTFHQLPYLPAGPIRSLKGRVNSTTFLGSAPGYTRFRGGRTVRDWMADGTVSQKVELVFVEREQPWGYFLRKNAITWDEIVDTVGNFTVTQADLSPLIQL